MKHLLFVLFISVSALSCKKDTEENTEPEFVKGDLLVGIDSTIQLDQVFNYVNALGLPIHQANGFHYTTSIPKDSIPYIKSVLNARSYINTQGFTASVWPHYQTGIVYNTSVLWDMTIPNQQDYMQTRNALRMTDIQSSTKSLFIKVPMGQEVYWRGVFKSFSWVRWSELNWIGIVELHR